MTIFFHLILLAHWSVTKSWFFQTTFPKLPNPTLHSYPAFHSLLFPLKLQIPGEEELSYKSDRDACQKIKIEPLRETNVGVVLA